jgi:hypothetical protein
MRLCWTLLEARFLKWGYNQKLWICDLWSPGTNASSRASTDISDDSRTPADPELFLDMLPRAG